MESVGTLYGGEWSSFNGTPNEESDFMAQLLGNYSYSSEQYGVTNVGAPSTFWPSHHEPSIGGSEGSYYCSDTFISNNGLFPQGSSYSNDTSYYLPSSGHQDYYVNDSNQIPTSMDYNMVGEQNTRAFTNNVIEEGICTNEETTNASFGASGGSPVESVALTVSKMQNKRKLKMLDLPTASEDPKMQVRKNKKNTPKGKKQKFEEEEATVGLNGQSSCSYSSEDDSNASQELNGGTTSSSKGSGSLNQSGKARASRGSATDPQSLYARKRRERINERLRILQNLVPNGTKVDISTMLEEAVEYVKFLQLQIKLLSSDDMWMYAPIAYNGMNIGRHNLNISQSQ